MMRLGITGIVAAPHTPFRPDGGVAGNVVRKQARLLAESRVAGAFICGTTGEGLSLSVEERMEVAEEWVSARRDEMPLLVHVGHNSLPEACRLAAHAQGIGAEAVASFAPCYYRPGRLEELVEFCGRMAASAPRLPFYYYYIPSMTGFEHPMEEFTRMAMDRIPSFAGIKFTQHDPETYGKLVDLFGDRLDLFFGHDEILLEGLRRGARAAVGSTYNYAAPLYHEIMKAYADGREKTAVELQKKSADLVERMIPFGVLAAGKGIMGMVGVDCGPVRLPNRALTPDDLRRLHESIRSLDIFSRPLLEPVA